MCVVHICTARGVIKANPADLDTAVRLDWAVKEMESWHRPKAQKQRKPIANVRTTYAPAPLQRGGDLVKPLFSYDRDKDDCGDHYRMRCNASHERRKTRFLTERRREVIRY
jgi:hypothetical protein